MLANKMEKESKKIGDLCGVCLAGVFNLTMYAGDRRLVVLYKRGMLGTESLQLIEKHLQNNCEKPNIYGLTFPDKNLIFEDKTSHIRYELNLIEYFQKDSGFFSTLRNNFEEMNKLVEGDVVAFNRGAYYHTAIFIDVEKFQIIHRSGEPMSKFNGGIMIRIDNLVDVFLGSQIKKHNFYDDTYPPRSPMEILEYAKSKLNEQGYNVLSNNCHHFAFECRNRMEISPPIEMATTVGTIMAASGLMYVGWRLLTRKTTQTENNNQNENEEQQQNL